MPTATLLAPRCACSKRGQPSSKAESASKGAAVSQRSTVFRQPHAMPPATITSQPWRRAGLGSLEALSPSFTSPKSLKRSPSILSFPGPRKRMPMRQHPLYPCSGSQPEEPTCTADRLIAPIRSRRNRSLQITIISPRAPMGLGHRLQRAVSVYATQVGQASAIMVAIYHRIATR